MASAPSDLSKLTVPQLKALCKERRITGYSKLSKAALLQKLAEAVVPAETTPTAQVQTAHVEPSTAHLVGSTAQQPEQAVSLPATNATIESTASTRAQQSIQPSGAIETTGTSTAQPAEAPQVAPLATASGASELASTSTAKPTELSKAAQLAAVTNDGAQKATGTKRPAHTEVPVPPKRIRTTTPSSNTNPERPTPSDASVFKIPELPVRPKKSLYASASRPVKQPRASGTAKRFAVSRQITAGPGRFKPLVVSRPQPVAGEEPSGAPVVAMPKTFDSALALSIRTMPLPVLSQITLPPKASERKWVHRWAIILSALFPKDRRACTLVSRTFRYAVYLSAAHILSRDYPGRRLNAILAQHPKNTTNFWPYLRFRVAENARRRQAFKRSFLGRYTDAIGYDPLSKLLWTCPDDEKQVDVALRFVLTRMWFATSIGAYGHDASAWSSCVVQDVHEVVKGDVWQVVTRDNNTGAPCSFYVLEATCEVIGRPPQGGNEDTVGYALRADWTAWISERSQDVPPLRSLLECVKWSNTEDYHRGISKAWLHRMYASQDADDIAKRRVAERYVLASVVANRQVLLGSFVELLATRWFVSISGQWMSTSAMAQEFAGLPGKHGSSGRALGRTTDVVNMYLPAHHHVESIHFTTSKGEVLHAAVAVVQTPGREYYVLKDNGMQVGCEEEGIPGVWQDILGCNSLGQAR